MSFLIFPAGPQGSPVSAAMHCAPSHPPHPRPPHSRHPANPQSCIPLRSILTLLDRSLAGSSVFRVSHQCRVCLQARIKDHRLFGQSA